jgi:histidinol-phosphate aminotransferase
LDTANEHTKLLFICSPGNPTCKAIPLADVEKIAASSSYDGIIVVDEAYVDFSDKGSAISLIHKYPNIVVLQTLSKAFGLAGIRCGFALGAPDVIQLMNNVKAPYNVNSLTSEVAMNAFDNIKVLEQNITTLLQQRAIVKEKLLTLDFVVRVYDSDSNFLLFRVKSKAQELYKKVRLVCV